MSAPELDLSSMSPVVAAYVCGALQDFSRRLRHNGQSVPADFYDYERMFGRRALRPPTAPSGQDRTNVAPAPEPSETRPMNHESLVTQREAAHLTGISERSIRRMQAAGELTPVRYRRSVRYRLGDLLQLTPKDN
jgi:hypothetical protein